MGFDIELPTPPPPPPTPQGTPADADAAARRWVNAATVVEAQQDHASGFAVENIGNDGSSWASPAAAAYVRAVAPIARETGLAYDALTHAARGLTSYADRLETLRHQYDTMLAEHTYLTREIAALSETVTQVAALPADAGAASIAAVRIRATELTHDAEEYTRRRQTFRREIAENEADLRACLYRVMSPRLTAQGIRSGALADSAADLRSALDKVHTGAVPSDIDTLAAAARAQWWANLTTAERDAVIREIPESLSHAGGLPASARDAANRVVLARDMAALDSRVAQHQSFSLLTRLSDRDKNVREIRAALDRAEREAGGEPVTLYDYDPGSFGGDGRAIIGIGDMDRASNVAFTVPGLGTTARSTSENVGNALALHRESKAAGGSVATVAWIGYDAPSGAMSVVDVSRANAAAAGGDALAADLRDFASAREAAPGGTDEPALHVIGHSYGSTTVGFAGADGRLAGLVDTVTLLGSPGAGPIDRAEDFGIGASNVFVAADDMDPVAHLGAIPGIPFSGVSGLGCDPLTTGFGAQRFAAESDSDSFYIDAHTGYFDSGSESLHNLAAIVSGHGESTTHDSRRGILDSLDRTELLHARGGLPGMLRRLPFGIF